MKGEAQLQNFWFHHLVPLALTYQYFVIVVGGVRSFFENKNSFIHIGKLSLYGNKTNQRYGLEYKSVFIFFLLIYRL